jgi:hypothetical protein
MPLRIRSHLGPEFPKSINPRVRRIARDDGRVDASDRNAGNPIRLYTGLGQCFIHPCLVRAERAATLQYQGHALERKKTLRRIKVRFGLNIHFRSPYRWSDSGSRIAGA